ncbi:probable E3 ubiquitin-protein ligase RHC2A [Prosopis cineraria]|uniref:probable E3 ubiquitin-protein ligase RHC2A n=1 Tax=Prosopis cineraria TaxID=364024 RepID=UPI00240EF1FD|nr:probable E3 ubiquitin-protein ligase RHC2A [Prosopis cineraria]
MTSIQEDTEDYFNIDFRVISHATSPETGLHESTSFPVFESPFLMPCEELLQDVPGFLRRNLANYLNEPDFHLLASQIISYYQEALQYTIFQAANSRIIPLNLDILLPSQYEANQDLIEIGDDDPELMEVYQAIEQSMQQLSTRPTSNKAIASLKKLKISRDEMKADLCSICLENFEDDEDASAMPCNHIYHRDCIVTWLKTNHTCPLCRFQMPVE